MFHTPKNIYMYICSRDHGTGSDGQVLMDIIERTVHIKGGTVFMVRAHRRLVERNWRLDIQLRGSGY